ncbi:MAG: hypothetical protein ACHQPI_09580 [Thermoanaerobaculia bacterium]
MVTFSPPPPPDFAERAVARRPFAPWEVRHASPWKVPALAGAGLLFSSAAIFVAPLAQLAPATALAVWGHLVTAALSSSVSAAFSAAPALAAAGDALRASVTPALGLVVLGSGALFGAATFASLRRRTARAQR